jgi:hypothetical protein
MVAITRTILCKLAIERAAGEAGLSGEGGAARAITGSNNNIRPENTRGRTTLEMQNLGAFDFIHLYLFI